MKILDDKGVVPTDRMLLQKELAYNQVDDKLYIKDNADRIIQMLGGGSSGAGGVNGIDGIDGLPGPAGPAGPAGVKGDTGVQGITGLGINVLPPVANEGGRLALSVTWTSLDNGKSVLQVDTGDFWTWHDDKWIDVGHFVGPQGIKGDTGAQGATGSAGSDGQDGGTGPTGSAGQDGPTGLTGPSGLDGLSISILPPVADANTRVAISLAWTSSDNGKSLIQLDTGDFWSWTYPAWVNAGRIVGADGSSANVSTGYKNKIINGNFLIWQRGTSFSHFTGYNADMWTNKGSSTFDVTKIIGSTRNMIKVHTTSSNTRILSQNIEDARTLNDKTVTLSFWNDYLTTMSDVQVELYQRFDDNRNSDVSVDLGIIDLRNVGLKTVTVQLPSTSGKHRSIDSALQLNFIFHHSGDFVIGDVQLEEGDTATNFEQRPIGLELSLCQRYYFDRHDETNVKGFATTNAGDTSRALNITFPVEMRVPPIVTSASLSIIDPASPVVVPVMRVGAITTRQCYYLTNDTHIDAGSSVKFSGGEFDATI